MSKARIPAAAVLFFVSGFSALLYQVIWQRVLGIFSGVHIYSVTMIVTAFMIGLGLGSLFGGRLGDRHGRRTALLLFAGCELGIGIFALASPWLYYDLAYLQLGDWIRTPEVLPLVHFALLLVPTLLMGASLPLLSRAVVPGVAGAARTIALLYGLNTAGAALGAGIASWVLIGAFGFVGTIQIGAVGNLLVAGAALALLPGNREDRATGEAALPVAVDAAVGVRPAEVTHLKAPEVRPRLVARLRIHPREIVAEPFIHTPLSSEHGPAQIHELIGRHAALIDPALLDPKAPLDPEPQRK